MNQGIRSTITSIIMVCFVSVASAGPARVDTSLSLNADGYYEAPGFNVMMFDDFYPEGHQGGLTIIQGGTRVAASGDLRLEPTPGQWSATPKTGSKHIDRKKGIIAVDLWYPDSSRDQKGFNPISYPPLAFHYTIRSEAHGGSIRIIVDLQKPLPEEWANKVGFNLELFPGHYFGEHYFMDNATGIFPRQANGPMKKDDTGNFQITPMAEGKILIIAPSSTEKKLTIESRANNLQLIDGRGLHNNGWFIVRSTIPTGAAKNAVEWIITPKSNPRWNYKPVLQVSQIGYHPRQNKVAVIELDKTTSTYEPVQLLNIGVDSITIVKSDSSPTVWGQFLRYRYLRFDFSDVKKEGLYKIRYGKFESNEFEIKKDVFARHVWQPSLEYFLPVQMCHVKICDRYKIWHGLCHMDDAVMAPINHNHFDGYVQGNSTLTSFKPGEHVPGLNIGGWHDAGDYDLRVESQAGTIYKLALAYEFFQNEYDETSIDQKTRVVHLHQPDGKPDMLQQIEHGVLSLVRPYESIGRSYRGIQDRSLQQYVHLGDASTVTDNLVYEENKRDCILGRALPNDDRMVFTENNPWRELYTAQALAAACRVLKTYDPELAGRCLNIAEELCRDNAAIPPMLRANAIAELYLTTSKKEYESSLREQVDSLCSHIEFVSETIGRVSSKMNNPGFTAKIETAVKAAYEKMIEQQKENPYGVPYQPYVWGAGWNIQSFGVQQLLLHLGFPKIVPYDYAFNAINFILGCHPGENTASFASGVGVNSLTVAYGVNRDDWSYIPGGVGSGTAIIRPDLPELKLWPYFWQQTEYVMGGGATDFMFLTMAADRLFNE
jgi:endoglucanase